MTLRRFSLLIALLLGTLCSGAFIEPHLDEDACVAIGWLLSQGWRLYADVFTHHAPLDYLPATVVAGLFGPSPTAARVFMLGLWAAAAATLFVALHRRRAGVGTAVLFAVLSSQWLTYWYGQMMLVENMWSLAVALALALLAAPLGLAPEYSPRRAAAFGALVVIVLSASPTCLPAAALLVTAFIVDARWRRLGWYAVLGAAAWLAIFGAWAAAYVDLGLLWEHVIVFNRDVYAPFNGIDGGAVAGFWRRALEHNAVYFASAFEGQGAQGWFEGVIKLSTLAWAAWSLAHRRWALGVWTLAFIVAVNARPERLPGAPPLHAAPFYLIATLALCAGLSRAWEALAGRRRAILAAAAAAVLLPTLWATSLATASLRASVRKDGAYESIVRAVRACAAPSERVVALPFYPRFYLDTALPPATPSVFYLPWQQAWEPQRRATLESLERRPPLAVLSSDTAVWSVPWRIYGAGIEAWLDARRYVTVVRGSKEREPSLALRVRPDAASTFKSCAARILTQLN